MSSNFYPTASDHFARTLALVTEEDWGRPTPCSDWNLRDLVSHVVMTHRRVRSLVTKSPPDELGDLDPVLAYNRESQAVRSDLATPDIAGALVSGRAGDQTYAALVESLLTTDTTCHAWDLARALGSDERLDEALVAHAHRTLEDLGDAARAPGGFGPALPCGEDDDAQTRFLRFAGRAV